MTAEAAGRVEAPKAAGNQPREQVGYALSTPDPKTRRAERGLTALSTRLARYAGTQAVPASSELVRFRSIWAEVAGADASDHALLVAFSPAGTLTIACESSAWARELRGRGDRLLARLRRQPGGETLRALRFTVAEAPLPARPPRPRRPSPAERARAAELTASVEDESLRVLLERAAALSLTRQVRPGESPARRTGGRPTT